MRNKLIIIVIFLWLFYFVSYPQDAFSASCSGILLWFEQILPSLLPYSILSNIILSSGLLSSIEAHQPAASRHGSLQNEKVKSHKLTIHHRHISTSEAFVIICGMTFGFPIGSKLAADLHSKGLITKERAQLLASFTNNMSPAFVTNYVLTYCLNRTDLQIQTFLLLYGIPLILGILGIRYGLSGHSYTAESHSNHEKPASRFHIDMQIIDAGITQSFETLIRLCGYIVIFSILAHIIQQFGILGKTGSILLTGIIEVTNGIGALPASGLPESTRYLLALVFLSFGGLSGIAQTGSIITPAGLSLRSYCLHKLALTAAILLAASACIGLKLFTFY